MEPKQHEQILVKHAILRSDAHCFANEHREETVLILFARRLFTEVLDNPAASGFNDDEVQIASAGIRVVDLHPTTQARNLCGMEKGTYHEEG